jgi:hypothetical protein
MNSATAKALQRLGIFHVPRKRGQVLFSHVPKIWESAVFTCPENLGECCFHVSRKSGRVLFSRVPKKSGVLFHLSRKCGRVLFSRVPKIWGCGIFDDDEHRAAHRIELARTLFPTHSYFYIAGFN